MHDDAINDSSVPYYHPFQNYLFCRKDWNPYDKISHTLLQQREQEKVNSYDLNGLFLLYVHSRQKQFFVTVIIATDMYSNCCSLST